MLIRVYTKPNCQPCRGTKRKLTQLGIPFQEVPMTEETTAYIKGLGYTSAPVVVAEYGDGVTLSWSGFQPSKIEQLKNTL